MIFKKVANYVSIALRMLSICVGMVGVGGMRQETRDRRQETRDKTQETGGKRQETRDKIQDTRDKRQETGGRRHEYCVFSIKKWMLRQAQHDKRKRLREAFYY